MIAEYLSRLADDLQILSIVSAKPMFGGHGLFLNGLMFALVTNNAVYLKAIHKVLEYMKMPTANVLPI
ncbi:MAG: DNA transformation protein [Porticoccus sp.]